MTDRELEDDLTKSWADPRGEEEFDAALFPGCNEVMVPDPGADLDRRSERRLQFLAIYYRLNCAYKSLDELDPEDGQRAEVLRRIERLSIARDILEDECAPVGFIGEPQMDGLYTIALEFTEPPTRHGSTGPPKLSSRSLCISIPIPGEDLEADTGVNCGDWVEVKTLEQISLSQAMVGSGLPAAEAGEETGTD